MKLLAPITAIIAAASASQIYPVHTSISVDNYANSAENYQTGIERIAIDYEPVHSGQTYQSSPISSHGYQSSSITGHGFQSSGISGHGFQSSPVLSHGFQSSPISSHGYQSSGSSGPSYQASSNSGHTYQSSPVSNHGYHSGASSGSSYQTSSNSGHTYQSSPVSNHGYRSSASSGPNYQSSSNSGHKHQTVGQSEPYAYDAAYHSKPGSPVTVKPARILGYNFENKVHNYQYAYETENGIKSEESGSMANKGTAVHGSYSYTGDDGHVYTVTYVADENGFRAQGAHLPTPPPMPEAIAKSLEKNAQDEGAGIYDDGQYREQQTYESSNNQRISHQPLRQQPTYQHGHQFEQKFEQKFDQTKGEWSPDHPTLFYALTNDGNDLAYRGQTTKWQ